jgi:hypothetical protein
VVPFDAAMFLLGSFRILPSMLLSHIWLKGKITAHFSIFKQKVLIEHAAACLTKYPALRIFCTAGTGIFI